MMNVFVLRRHYHNGCIILTNLNLNPLILTRSLPLQDRYRNHFLTFL